VEISGGREASAEKFPLSSEIHPDTSIYSYIKGKTSRKHERMVLAVLLTSQLDAFAVTSPEEKATREGSRNR
jgi:hypothetical protein